MLNCLSLCPAGVKPERYADCSPVINSKDGPPGPELITQLFIRNRAPVFLLGAAAVIAGLVLIGLNFFSFGLTLPIALPVGLGLISLGAAAIALSCTANCLLDSDGKATAGDEAGKKLKPRGHRAYSRYVPRKKPGTQAARLSNRAAMSQTFSAQNNVCRWSEPKTVG